MIKNENYLNEMKELWKNEPQQSRRWQFWYLTPTQRLTILRELLYPLTPPTDRS